MPKSIWETLKQFGRGGPPPTPAEMISRVYGTGPRGGPNTRAAAADLGVSPRTVSRWAHQGIPDTPSGTRLLRLFGSGGPTPAEMISRVYGTGPRGGLNTRAAAADLGVSPRTVSRWAHEGIPDSAGGTKLQRSYRDWENTTPAGKAIALQSVEAAKRGQPMAVAFYGKVIISQDPRNATNRSLSFTLSPAETNLLLDTARIGQEADLHAALEYIAASKGFGGGVSLDITDLNIR